MIHAFGGMGTVKYTSRMSGGVMATAGTTAGGTHSERALLGMYLNDHLEGSTGDWSWHAGQPPRIGLQIPARRLSVSRPILPTTVPRCSTSWLP